MRSLIFSLLAAVSLAGDLRCAVADAGDRPGDDAGDYRYSPSGTASNAAASTQAALKALQAMKAANEEILKQQAATLQQLDEMEKAADADSGSTRKRG